MKKEPSFTGRYEVSDGYVGGSRPQYININSNDLEDDMEDWELENLFYQIMKDHFEEHITPSPTNLDDFIEWAKDQLEKRKSRFIFGS